LGVNATPGLAARPGITRNTRQRGEVLALLEETDGFRSAQQLHADLRARGARVGLTTVYRTLQLLTDAGEVDQMRRPDGEQLYRRCAQLQHHHHLVCRACGRTVEVEGPAVERWAQRTAAQHGFIDVVHTLEIVGTCTGCTRVGHPRPASEVSPAAAEPPAPAADPAAPPG
jgi:Fur family transcriptional regulator, ferric uptake regulator